MWSGLWVVALATTKKTGAQRPYLSRRLSREPWTQVLLPSDRASDSRPHQHFASTAAVPANRTCSFTQRSQHPSLGYTGQMNEVFICDAIRTPFGRYGGSLSTIRTDDLAAIPISALMDRNPASRLGRASTT